MSESNFIKYGHMLDRDGRTDKHAHRIAHLCLHLPAFKGNTDANKQTPPHDRLSQQPYVLLCFNPSNAGLGALYGASVSRMLPTSVHCIEVDAFKGTTNFTHHPVLGGRSSVSGGLSRCSTGSFSGHDKHHAERMET